MMLVGDVSGKVAILIDDIADTCGTIVMAAEKCATCVCVCVCVCGILQRAIRTHNVSKSTRSR
jgi:phosphoribosylpyrophosphate synthetase